MTDRVSPRSQHLLELQTVNERLRQGMQKFSDPIIAEQLRVEKKDRETDQLVEIVQLVETIEQSGTLIDMTTSTQKLRAEARELKKESALMEGKIADLEKIAEQIEKLVHNGSK